MRDAPQDTPSGYAAARALAERAPLPARWRALSVGTAGWTDPTLLKQSDFYPAGSAPQARLEHYARHFCFVEVDATYYALLAPETAQRWVQWTPASFEFHVKAHPVFSGHRLEVARLPRDLRAELDAAGRGPHLRASEVPRALADELKRRFVASVEPLRGAGRLRAIAVQFPPWFDATRGNARALEALRSDLPDHPLSVEFRHPSWLEPGRRDRVLALLSEHQLTYVAVDEPAVRGGGVPAVLEVTTPGLAVVRFHGQNAHGWGRRGASVHERFNYLYSPDELRRWAEQLEVLQGRAARVHAIFNNCVRDYAVRGAQGLVAAAIAAQGDSA